MSINPRDVGTRFNYLGKSIFPWDPLFSGRFDDFRFVSSALSDAQVAAIYTTPPPRFLTSPLYKPDAPVGQPYTDTLAGDAAGTGPLTYEKRDGPAWLDVDADGTLTGTPGPTEGGLNTFLVRVTDGNGSMHTATLLISVPTVTLTVTSSADDAEQSAQLNPAAELLSQDSQNGAQDRDEGKRAQPGRLRGCVFPLQPHEQAQEHRNAQLLKHDSARLHARRPFYWESRANAPAL